MKNKTKYSFIVIPDRFGTLYLEIMSSDRLSMGAKVLFSCLVMIQNDFKSCSWASDSQLGEYIGVTGRQARRYLSELQNNNIITRNNTIQNNRTIYINTNDKWFKF